MIKGRVINSWEVKPFICDDTYSSKMLLDDIVAETKAIHINEGTLKGGCSTPGAVHSANEIYYVIKGEAVLHLGDELIDIKPGSLVFIPAGVFHSLDNKSKTEDFVLLTIWEDTKYNEVYHARLKAWGKSFKTIYEN
ncbi:MAG: cupin domain-containing protein [Clostridiales bacterium]|nr:cupin domain-containing protein [Alcaligenaceae bacterium]NLO83685.1 cupin domain-containing protein [Clostridiales bacterium]